jgi:hypothetical protein
MIRTTLHICAIMVVVGCGGSALSPDQPYIIEVESPIPDASGAVPLIAAWWSPSYDPVTGAFRARDGLVNVTALTATINGDDVHQMNLSRPLVAGFSNVISFDIGPLGGIYFDEGGQVSQVVNGAAEGVVIDPATLPVGQFIVGGSRVSDNEFRLILEYRYDCGDDNTASFSGTNLGSAPESLACVAERLTLHGTTGAASF